MNTHPINTYLRKYLVLLGFCAAAIVFAACATTRTDTLRASAARLDDASSRFSAEFRYQGDDNRRERVSRDAETMARAAHNFNFALRNGKSRADVEDEYRRVRDSYGELHSQLADQGYAEQNRRVLEDFDRLTTTYRDVEAAMASRTADSRY
ncbi:MAG TPA: hypothetical protein VET48_05035 [Steroidobacteraceae bacterium]|nr:hypothetical protein [Steroidobacteraceae bacterium]